MEDCVSVANELLMLQKSQLAHDEIAHKDILCLPVQARIKHMVLHFAKYTGHFLEAKENQQLEVLKSTVVDAWIIALASSNMLNLHLSKELHVKDFQCSSLQGLGHIILNKSSFANQDPYDVAIFGLGKITGRMAKACESLDHMERFDSRGVLDQCILEAVGLLIALSSLLQLNLPRLVCERWKKVESKLILSDSSESASPVAELSARRLAKIG